MRPPVQRHERPLGLPARFVGGRALAARVLVVRRKGRRRDVPARRARSLKLPPAQCQAAELMMVHLRLLTGLQQLLSGGQCYRAEGLTLVIPQHDSEGAYEQENHDCKGALQGVEVPESLILSAGLIVGKSLSFLCTLGCKRLSQQGLVQRARVLVRERGQPCRNVRRWLLRGPRNCHEYSTAGLILRMLMHRQAERPCILVTCTDAA